MRHHLPDFLQWSGRLVLALAAIVVFWLIISSVAANAADNLGPCLTLQQARAKYPTTHLWWYYDADKHRCWSARRGGPSYRDPVMSHRKVAGELNAVHWYPQPFDAAHAPVDPPLLVSPQDYELPGNLLWSAEPNEIDKLIRQPFIPWNERIEGAL